MKDLLTVDIETGEEISHKEYKDKITEERNKMIKRLYWLIENDSDKLTLEEVELLMKLEKRSTSNIKLNFKRLPHHKGYFICNNADLDSKLNINTMGLLYRVGRMLTHEGRLKYNNNRVVKSIKDLKTYLNISDSTWTRHINKDIKRYNILSKETFKNGSCILLNPIFATTTRKVTETLFIAFHKELREYLSPMEYFYLERIHKLKLD